MNLPIRILVGGTYKSYAMSQISKEMSRRENDVHLDGEQDNACTPERPDTRLGSKRTSGLVLVRVDQVVVRSIIQEDEPKADREPSDARSYPVYSRVTRPGEDEQADGDEPAREHHGDKTYFWRRYSTVFDAKLFVVVVD